MYLEGLLYLCVGPIKGPLVACWRNRIGRPCVAARSIPSTSAYHFGLFCSIRPEKYTIKPERKEIAAVSIDLTRHDDFQGPRKLEVQSRENSSKASTDTCASCFYVFGDNA